jgi:uncharacterized membrane protein YfcA
MDSLTLVLLGLAGGFFAGLLGIGGGILYIVILPIILGNIGVPQEELVQFVIANSLFGTFAASLTGVIAHARKGEFYPVDTLWVGIAAVCVSLLSLKFIVNTEWYDQRIFNIVIVFILAFILFRTVKSAGSPSTYNPNNKDRNRWLAGSGVSGGLIASLSGLGGGAIIVPILNLGLGMEFRRAKTISLGMIVMSSGIMTIYNSFQGVVGPPDSWSTGYLVWSVALTLSAGVVVGSPIGVKVARKLPVKILSYIFSLFLLIVMVSKLWELGELYL